jgi:2-dehydropantoate 2-reductase
LFCNLDAANTPSPIVIAGAGSVGCYVGGALAHAGRAVTLLLRPALADAIAAHGLITRNLSEPERHIPASAFNLATDPSVSFRNARLILVTVKSGATAAMAKVIGTNAPEGTIVVSLQNGTGNALILRDELGAKFTVLAGMVPFNVVQSAGRGEGQGEMRDGTPRFARATSGTVLIEQSPHGIADVLNVPGLPVATHSNMPGVLWSKLIINLNNAINALCGLPLTTELGDRRWRAILARQQREALGVLRTAGIKTVALEGVRPGLLPVVLGLPDPLFRQAARAMLAIDPEARSSMWEDLERRRPTEIGAIQGAIQQLAAAHNVPVPLTDRIVALIRAAEGRAQGSPKLLPEDVWPIAP